jgi:hypothetical protein
MRTAHLAGLATSAVFLSVLLGACGGSGGSSTTASNASAAGAGATTAATSTAAASAASGSSGASAGSGVTKPGTALTVGQTATVTYTPLTSSGTAPARTIKITVASIRTGSAADLKGVDISGAPKGAVPQYATVTVANLGPSSIDVDGTSDAMQGIDHSGNQQDSVSFIGDFPPCNQNSSTTPVASGQSFHTCLTFLVAGGITKVGYTGTESYTNSPVTWSAGS